jgi:hypothetical protein
MNKKIHIIMGLTIVILSFAFYWLEWRPSQLIRACHLWSLDRVTSINGGREDVNYFYRKCLRENGIDR